MQKEKYKYKKEKKATERLKTNERAHRWKERVEEKTKKGKNASQLGDFHKTQRRKRLKAV